MGEHLKIQDWILSTLYSSLIKFGNVISRKHSARYVKVTDSMKLGNHGEGRRKFFLWFISSQLTKHAGILTIASWQNSVCLVQTILLSVKMQSS